MKRAETILFTSFILLTCIKFSLLNNSENVRDGNKHRLNSEFFYFVSNFLFEKKKQKRKPFKKSLVRGECLHSLVYIFIVASGLMISNRWFWYFCCKTPLFCFHSVAWSCGKRAVYSQFSFGLDSSFGIYLFWMSDVLGTRWQFEFLKFNEFYRKMTN